MTKIYLWNDAQRREEYSLYGQHCLLLFACSEEVQPPMTHVLVHSGTGEKGSLAMKTRHEKILSSTVNRGR